MNKYTDPYLFQQGIDYDDVLIKPILSTINSRNDVDISVKLSEFLTLEFPLIVSPMRGIVDAKFGVKIAELGGIAILHRFYNTKESWLKEIKIISKASRFGLSIGHNGEDYRKILSYNPDILVIDVANGYTKSLLEFCNNIKKYIVSKNYKTLLMSGNVATASGVKNMIDNGVDIVRVGIGTGGLCSTRNVTGIGIPQITALLNCSLNSDTIIVSDGGIRNSGDFVKSVVAGADLCMAGSLFAQTYESISDGIIYGMASRKLQEFRNTQIKSIEGFEKIIEKKTSLKQFIDDFSWGIKSAGTYLNANNLKEIRTNGEFILSGKNSIKEL